MKRTQRTASLRTTKLVSLVLCFSLIAAAVMPLSSAGAKENRPVASSSGLMSQSGLIGFPSRVLGSFLTLLQGGGLPSVPGPNLPDLDAARQLQPAEPQAPPPIASSQPNPDICANCDPTNNPPIANPGGPYYGSANQAIPFSGIRSHDVDPGDGISDYAWTFGDGATVVHGATPSHTYQAAGTFTVSLTVTDHHGESTTATTHAFVNAGPTPTPTPSASPSPSPEQTNNATFVSQTVPSTMTAGERYPVSVTMRNTGSTNWSAAHLYRLGSQGPQDNSLWGRARAYLPAPVAPGADAVFNFTVLAPYSGSDEPGPATFQWRMVQDGVGYFGDVTQNQSVTIASNYQPPYGDAPQFGPLSDLFMSRIAVQHRTGQSGEDLLSGNYNWGMSLLDLPGRAGLGLNLGLSYNSLATWTKVEPPYLPLMPPEFQQSPSWTFDADRGFPSVGFRLGFPTIQGPFGNVQTGAHAFLLLMTSGARVELRQIGSSNVYEAADSSYLQLVDGGSGGLLLRTTDGSQLAYLLINGEYRCTEIKDRNGNYITIKYDPINNNANPGRVTSIIDTLGRTINFIYDSNYRVQTIEQLRSGQSPHVWASFGYSDLEVQPNFAASRGGEEVEAEATSREGKDSSVLGLPKGNTVSVLTQVGLADGSRYNFDYTSWGQIWRTHHYAADGNELSYTAYDLPQDNSHPQTDCPRFTQRQDWVKNWNDHTSVTTTFQIDPNGEGQWGKVTAPDGTAYKEFFTTDYTAWQRGLVTRTETYAAGSTTPKKTTITDWTQGNLGVPYPLNPRATATTISDAEGNRRRTTIDYYDSFGLPSDVFEWGPGPANSWSLLRRTHTDYELSATYVNQRIIGLSKQQFLFGPEDYGQRLYSKLSFEYDAGGEFLQNQGNPVQHDENYGSGLVQGRGNMTKALRWDANYETDITHATASTVGYNTSGSTVFSRDPLGNSGRQTTISYNDAFSSNGTDTTTPPLGVTLAYPTTVTVNDPDPISATAKYNYDLGAVTRQQDPKGAAQTTEYDAVGRVMRVTNAVNGAYTRFVYPTSQTIVNKFTTINDLAHEAYTATVFDGAGRVRAVAGDFPNSTGHYSGQFTLYDLMGRAIQQTNPTEMTNVWAAAGDDVAGWHSSLQTYDWKGRPLVTTNQDGTTKEASYGGCGCAGGAVVTLTDEGTLVDIDPGPAVNNVTKKRQQKIYSDPLGRTVKTETLNWDGPGLFGTGGSVYSTTLNTYNVRDQVTLDRQYEGTDTSGVFQDTTMSYDGYGRLKTNHAPEQDANTATTYAYNPDDTVQSVTDARGAAQAFSYNARHLVTSVNYSGPAGITSTPSVSFDYDAAGNRTSMSDGLGSVSYTYDQLSRLTSETRTFNGVGTYPLSYGYNLSGELTSLTDSFNAQVGYNHDSTGKLTTVTGSGFGNVSTYASDLRYRAGGELKQMTYGNGRTLEATYNARLQTATFTVSGVVSMTYQRSADGSVNYSHDLLDQHFDRSYSYDHAGRLTQALSGAEARGEPASAERPYKQNFGFDVWENMTSRTGKHWSHNTVPFSGVYVNNRMNGWQYDADGRNTVSNSVTSTFDAAGQLIQTVSPQRRNNPPLTLTQAFDGDGQRLKKNEYGSATYQLRSTVLRGEVVADIYGSAGQANLGQKQMGHVYANGKELAEQNTYLNVAFYKHPDPSGSEDGTSYTHPDGTVVADRTQLDPIGDDAGDTDPYLDGGGGDSLFVYPRFGDIADNPFGCIVDGVPWPCTLAVKYISLPGTRIVGDNLSPFSFGGGLLPGGHLRRVYGNGSKLKKIDWDNNVVTVGPDENTYEWVPDATFLPMEPLVPQNSGGGGGAGGPSLNTGPLAHFDSKRFNKCLQDFFGIVPQKDGSIRNPFFDRRYGGSFTGFANGNPGHTYTVITNINKNSGTLAQDLNRASGTPHRWIAQSGFTSQNDFQGRFGVNFVASDAVAFSKFLDIGLLGTYIHELGNGLGVETGMGDPFGGYAAANAKAGISDADVGAAFERCVFGGLVGLRTGRIGTNREF